MTNNKPINSEFDIYLENVSDPQDIILFEDAIKSANLGMYRSAYILTWLCCAESLKRRFRECGKYDAKANDIYSQIINLEKKHKAADESILERAKNYGFISDFEHTRLKQLYELRCVYAHPYETAPTKINVESAISDIVNTVLSEPAMLSESYIDQLVNKLTNDINYINDYYVTVKKETQNWLNKINSLYYRYFIEKYSDIIEIYSNDNTKELFIRRAKWVIEEILLRTKYNIYTDEEWHNFIIKYPIFSINLAINNKDFFLNIGERAQDYLISKILEISNYAPGYLQILAPYLEDKDILRDNYSRIISRINSLSLDAVKSSGLAFDYWIDSVFKELESGVFYRQNSAINLIKDYEQEIHNLCIDKQYRLGEEIFNAAYRGAWTAKNYSNTFVANPKNYPIEFLRGFCSALINENEENSYVFLNDDLLKTINNLIENLGINSENHSIIIEFANEMINKYVKYELSNEYNTLEKIKKRLHTEKYTWIKIDLQGNND